MQGPVSDGRDVHCVRKNRAMTRIAFLLGLSLTSLSVHAMAQTETVLYTFGRTPADGTEPAAPLLLDGSGNLFGTTSGGGTAVLCPDPSGLNACGTVFELVNSSGNYKENVLYNFIGAPSDGDEPTAGLIMDASGNLYGTTGYGGPDICGLSSCGTAFELVKSSSGYTKKLLHNFTGFDGANPLSGLIRDTSGNLYGTTNGGGAFGFGTVFELVNSTGGYTENVLYSFGASATDGWYPVAGLVMDSAGNLFGTTSVNGGPYHCGLSSCGTIFELVNSPGGYTERVLHTFSESEGANPLAALITDSSGNLYGTTSDGGAYGSGTVFELTNASGNYAITVLHSFGGTPTDGVMPVAGLLMDTSGNLFGTTKMGGSATLCSGYGCGTVFELVHSSGTYAEKVLHSFGGIGDGESPAAALIMDRNGNLYSTTEVGQAAPQVGIVFEVNPAAPAPVVTLSASSLTFSEMVNTSSTPQSITVTNGGSANLIFGSSGVALSGANAAEFAIGENTCSHATIAPQATCSVSVTFTPNKTATATAGLTFSDNAPDSTQKVTLAGTGLATPTTTTVTSSNSSIVVGTNVTFTAQIAPVNAGGPTPTGTIQFTANGTSLGSTTVSGSEAQISTSNLAVGSISILASYSGDSNYSGSTGSLTETVTAAPTYTVFASPTALTISAPGQPVSTTLTFTSQNGFTGSGTLSSSTCGVSAVEEITCSLAEFTLPANGTATSVLTFRSTAASNTSASMQIRPQSGPPAIHLQILPTLASACFVCFAALGFAFRCKDRCGYVVFTVLLFVATETCVSCGGGSGSGGGVSGNPGTPIGPVQGLAVSISINGTTKTVPSLTLTVE